MKQKRGELCKCPHCDEDQESPIEDYCCHYKGVGSVSTERDMCWDAKCGEVFEVTYLGGDDFEVFKVVS